MARNKDDLWRDFPKTAIEFERLFATEEACRSYWIEARWGGEPACARCGSKRVWAERGGFLFECADCDHQTSLTSGTLLEKTRKPFKVWFRAVFEISSRRNGISAKELQRILGRVRLAHADNNDEATLKRFAQCPTYGHEDCAMQHIPCALRQHGRIGAVLQLKVAARHALPSNCTAHG
jgi:hypothetical protein